MTKRETPASHHLLGLFGVAAFIICVLACRPAFSPDGKKVLFPMFDEERKQTLVALYDRRANKTEVIFRRPWQGVEPVYATGGWSPDGKWAIIASAQKETQHMLVTLLPVGQQGPARVLVVPDEALTLGLIQPPPVVGHYVFFSGAGIVRLNLESGETKVTETDTSKNDDIAWWMFAQAGRLYCLKSEEHRSEVSTLDPETLVRTPILQIDTDEKDDASLFPAVSKDGSRIAVVIQRKEEKKHTIQIYHGRELERTLPLDTTDQRISVCNLVWSADEKTIFAAVFRAVEAADAHSEQEFILYELPLHGGRPRVTPLCRLAGKDAPLSCQIALAPDGKTIAASTGPVLNSDLSAPGDRALYLVDVAGSKRKVRKITLPAPQVQKAAK